MNTLHFIVMTCLLMFATSASAVEQITFYHNDAAGSPIAATDGSGNLSWDQAYDAWGVPIPNPSGDPRGFTGASRDSDTGLSDLQARWYSSELGRMLAMDPVSFHEEDIQSFNFYAYANNNPYRYLDADGRNPTPFSMHLNDTRIRAIAKSDPAFHAEAKAWQATGTVIVSLGIGATMSPLLATSVSVSQRTGLIDMPIPSPGTPGAYRPKPDAGIPRDPHGHPKRSSDLPHTQIGTKTGTHGDYTQAREWTFDRDGTLVVRRDIDFTDHNRPSIHPNPHQHDYLPNPTGGTRMRSKEAKPLELP